MKAINNPRLPNLAGKRRALEAEITSLGASDLDADEANLGLKGSPTRVVKVHRHQVTREGPPVQCGNRARNRCQRVVGLHLLRSGTSELSMSNNSEKHQEVWTLAEVRQGNIHPVSMELLAWGRSLADELGVDLASVVIGTGMREQVPLLFAGGADKVYLVDSPACLDFGAHPQSEVLIHLVQQYQPDILLASATTTGRTVMPYCAARLHTGLTADCTGLTIEPKEKLLIQTRPAIGGNVMATIKTPDCRPQMATVRPKSKRPLPPDANPHGNRGGGAGAGRASGEPHKPVGVQGGVLGGRASAGRRGD